MRLLVLLRRNRGEEGLDSYGVFHLGYFYIVYVRLCVQAIAMGRV